MKSVLWVLAPSLVIVMTAAMACGGSYGDGSPPTPDAATPPSSASSSTTVDSGSAPSPDASTAQDAANGVSDASGDVITCPTATEALKLSADGVLNPSTQFDHQDLSGLPSCNLAQVYCLMRFTRQASLGRKLVAVKLTVPRATSTDCGGDSCTGASYHGAGTILARQMRTDWSAKATWTKRRPDVNDSDLWATEGALGAKDVTMDLGHATVGTDAHAVLDFDPTLLSATFLTDAEIAFRLQPSVGFEFVIQRMKGSSLSRATLAITYCVSE